MASKNTSSSAFRKIDVDQFDEELYTDDEAELQSPSVRPDENEINSLLNQGRQIDALKVVLRSAPLGTKNQQLKDFGLTLVLKVLMSIKSSQIEEAVTTLDRDLVDVLMKYIYRGFEYPSEGSNGHLLLWHEKAYAVGGVGSIIRVLTDHKRA